MSAIHGSCLCEAVRYEVTPPTKWCAHCHCTLCRRAHGAGVVTWFGVANENFRLTSGQDTVTWYASSPEARRGFCSRCGSMLFFEGQRWPGEIHIARASVPGDIDRAPSAHVFFDRHVEWLTLGDDLQRRGGPSGMQPL